MELYLPRAVERAMKVQEVILRAMSGQIKWFQAAEIIGVKRRPMRRWGRRLATCRCCSRTDEVKRLRKSQWRVVESYLGRRRLAETIRFIKQRNRVKDIGLPRYERLYNLANLVLEWSSVAGVYLVTGDKLAIPVQHIELVAKRIFGIPELHSYAISDGIKQVLFGRATGIGSSRGEQVCTCSLRSSDRPKNGKVQTRFGP